MIWNKIKAFWRREGKQSFRKKQAIQDLGSSIVQKYQMGYVHTMKSPELVHLWKKDTVQDGMNVVRTHTETERIVEREIQSFVKMNYVYKQDRIKFDDIRRLFKSLTLEEEKEFSTILAHYLSEDLNYLQKIVQEEHEQIEKLGIRISSLNGRMHKFEENGLWMNPQNEREGREEENIKKEVAFRELAEVVAEQIEKQLKLERARRGY